MNRSRPVLVFDSGLGGLSVLKAIREVLPGRRFVYLADDAGFPYGERGASDLLERVVRLTGEAVERHNPVACVIACNTASTLVLPALRAKFAVPFVGTVPAIKPAAQQTKSGLISVLATPATVKRDYTRDMIAKFAGDCRVRLVGAPGLAAMAELHLGGAAVDKAALADEIAPCFVEEEGRRTDIVVLACTHYPFLIAPMSERAAWPVSWLDPAPAIARQLVRVLDGLTEDEAGNTQGTAARRTDRAHFTSGRSPGPVERRLLARFGLSVAEPAAAD